MSYIVKNCPACHNYYSNIYECHQMDDCDDNSCSSYTDCVIKQVIEKCNIYKNFIAITISDYAKKELAFHILDLFDIEEVNK